MTAQVSIADACSLVTDGTHYTPADIGVGYPFLTVKDVSDSGLDFDGCARISTEDFLAADSGNSAPKFGDVLFSKDGTVGKVHVVKTDERFAVLSSLAILRPKGDVVPDYLGHVLRFPLVLDEALKRKTGSAIRRIVLSDLKQVRIPLPSTEEQRRIAAILDKADALRTKRREALAQLDRLAQAIFVEMFGEPVTNPMGLPRVPLGELLASGPQNGLYKPSSEYGSGALILRIDAFYDGVVTGMSTLKRVKVDAQELALYGLREDEIVINRVNSPAYLGKSAIIPALPEPVVFESNMMRFALNTEHCLPSYLNSFLQTAYMKAQIRTASKDAVNQSSINQQDVKSFIINLPPLALQHSYSKRLAEVERLRTRFVKATGEGDNLFASLQHRAFRGEL